MSAAPDNTPIDSFREQFRKDRETGTQRTLEDYLVLFRGDEVGVAQEYLSLVSGGQDGDASGEPSSRPSLTSQDLIGSYQIRREIGRGGQGVVYLAEDQRLGRKVALKVLTGLGSASEAALKRFQREAEVASKLDDPGVCTVYEAGVESGVPFIAMQFIEGQSLARKILDSRHAEAPHESTIIDFGAETETVQLDEGGAPARPDVDPAPTPTGPSSRHDLLRVVALIEKTARSLHSAHQAGVVHRDVKPGNIMITPSGDPVVLDFGLARDEDADLVTLTQTGEIFGTPAYMSPEQLSHKNEVLDGRTDVYALGVILYECLTLRRPFEAPSRQALFQAILTRSPADPRRLNPAIPKDLKVVLETALEKDRGRRYQSAEAFAEDLRRVRQLEPVSARPVGALSRVWRSAQRNPVAAASIVVAALVLAGGIGLGAFLAGRADSERKAKEEAEQKRNEALAERDEAQQERDRLKAMMEELGRENQVLLPALAQEEAQIGEIGETGAAPPPAQPAPGIAKGAPSSFAKGAPVTVKGRPEPAGAARPRVASGDTDKGVWRFQVRPQLRVLTIDGKGSTNPVLKKTIEDLMHLSVTATETKDFEVQVQRIEGQLENLVDKVAPADKRFVASLFASLGDSLEGMEQHATVANEAYDRARQLYGESGQATDQAAIALSRAATLRRQERLGEATRELGRALRIFEAGGNEAGVAAVVQNRGTLYGMMGRDAAALKDFQRAAELHTKLGNKAQLGTALVNKGVILQRKGRFTESCEAIQKGRELGGQTRTFGRDSELRLKQARHLAALEKKLEAGKPRGKAPMSVRDMGLMADIALRKGQVYTAARLFKRSFERRTRQRWMGSTLSHLRAGRAAALVSVGADAPSAELSKSERASWRKRSLRWLEQALESRTRGRRRPSRRHEMKVEARALLDANDLSPLRSGSSFDALPTKERRAWTDVWKQLASVARPTR